MKINNEVKKIINLKRKQQLLTFKDLATKLGMKDEKNLINYINGKRITSYKMIYRIAKVLEINYNDLIKLQKEEQE